MRLWRRSTAQWRCPRCGTWVSFRYDRHEHYDFPKVKLADGREIVDRGQEPTKSVTQRPKNPETRS